MTPPGCAYGRAVVKGINMQTSEPAQITASKTLGEFIKSCRLRVDRGSLSLGMCPRLPSRVGKAATQEEVAEAAGISRVWYAMIEGNRHVSVSARVLQRIAEVLMLDAIERDALLRLALPEVRTVAMSERALGALHAFASVRRLCQRLWTATTESEALKCAREHVATEIAPDASLSFEKTPRGNWIVESTTDDDGDDRVHEAIIRIQQSCGDASVDDLHCYTIMTQPGELISNSDRDALFPETVARAGRILDEVKLSGTSFTMAHVPLQGGIMVRLSALYNASHHFSELERVQLSTIAELTSLAMSGK
jgi:transcriptional regulator with XRE-family HTH domain